jgi:hypothetical protein
MNLTSQLDGFIRAVDFCSLNSFVCDVPSIVSIRILAN